MKLPGFELNANQLPVNLAKENDEYEISKYATAKRKGDFYVVQYKGTSNTYFGEKLEEYILALMCRWMASISIQMENYMLFIWMI